MFFLYSFCVGTLFGSFANVYFYRFCQDLSIAFPNSFCPSCKTPIRWYDNIPILSFFLLRGHCRDCGAKISWTYPFTEFLCGLLFLFIAAVLKDQLMGILLTFLILFFLLFLIGGTDLVTFFETGKQYGIIPDSLVLILAASSLLFSFFNPAVQAKWWMAIAGGIVGLAVGYFIRWTGEKVFNKEALGLGDVKLLGAIGTLFGWKGVLFTLFFGSLTGSIVSILLIATHKLHKESAIPFGPFLALGSLSGLFI